MADDQPFPLDEALVLAATELSFEEMSRIEAQAFRKIGQVLERERAAIAGRLLLNIPEGTFGSRQMVYALDLALQSLTVIQEAMTGILEGATRDAAESGIENGLREVATFEEAAGSAQVARRLASLTSKVLREPAVGAITDAIGQLFSVSVVNYLGELESMIRMGVVQALLQGRNSRQVALDLARQVGAAFEGKAWMLERDLRIGLSGTVNRAHNESYVAAREELLPDLKRAGLEHLRLAEKSQGKRRNHPFSRYLHGKVAELNEPWTVHSPEFSGMFWLRDDGAYSGMHYPAHINERGRQVPYRAAWEAFRQQYRAANAV